MKPLKVIVSIVVTALFLVSSAQAQDIDVKRYDHTTSVDLVKETAMFTIGNGPIQALLIVDPECPYSHRALLKMSSSATKMFTIYVVPHVLTFLRPNVIDKYRWILSTDSEEKRMQRFLAISKGDTTWKTFKPTSENIEKTNFIIKKGMYTAQRMKVRGTPSFYVNEIGKEYFRTSDLESLLTEDGKHYFE